MRYGRLVLVPLVLPCLTVLSNCGAFGPGFGRLGEAACPELGGNADALRAQQAAKDLGAVSLQIEAEAAEACQRMAMDLGASPQEFTANNEPGARANVAC